MVSLTPTDLSDWQEATQQIQPLDKAAVQHPDMPKRLRAKPVPQRVLAHTLDLHGYTLQEAFEAVSRFILIHQKAKSKKIAIITGRGLGGEGKIKKEMPLWLQTPFFSEKVHSYQWKNNGGVIEITLKKQEK